MKSRYFVLPVLLCIASPAAQPEVTAAGENGFSIHHTVPLDADPAKAYRAITDEVGDWWIADHTWSGD